MNIPEFLTSEDVANIDSFDVHSYEFTNAVRNAKTTGEALELLTDRDLPYNVNTTIAENPNASHDVLAKLASKSRHRWEWRAISAGFRRKIANIAEHDENTPYASSIIRNKVNDPVGAAAYFVQTGKAIAEDLWHDLGSRGIISLAYMSDNVDGDHFGPIYDDKFGAFDVNTPAEYLLSPGYFCDWIETVPDPDRDYIESVLVDEFEIFMEDLENVIDRIDDSIMILLAATYGVTHGHLEIADPAAYKDLMIDGMEDYSPEQLDQAVEIISEPDQLEGPRFNELTEAEREVLVDNLVTASGHYIHKFFGTTAHLLNLILLHPETSESIRKRIREARVPGTEQTLQSMEGTE